MNISLEKYWLPINSDLNPAVGIPIEYKFINISYKKHLLICF